MRIKTVGFFFSLPLTDLESLSVPDKVFSHSEAYPPLSQRCPYRLSPNSTSL